MEKEAVQLLAECVKCSKTFNLDDDLIDADWNKTIPEVLDEKYGSCELICPDCRGILRIVEEGQYKFLLRKEGDVFVKDLVLISKDNTRKIIHLDEEFTEVKTYD